LWKKLAKAGKLIWPSKNHEKFPDSVGNFPWHLFHQDNEKDVERSDPPHPDASDEAEPPSKQDPAVLR